MQSAAIASILLHCYLLTSWNGLSLGQGASYPKPSIEVIPSNVIIRGGNVTIRCSSPATVLKFILLEGTQVVQKLDRRGNVAEFRFTDAQQRDSGRYTCRYNPTSDASLYSDVSDTIELEVREFFPKPSLQVRPGNVAVRGGTLSFRCTGEQANMRFILRYRGATELQKVEPLGKEAEFTITDVHRKDEGSYDCYYQTKSAATVYSASSDSIDIRVRAFAEDIASVTDDAGTVAVPGRVSVTNHTCTVAEPDFTQRNIVQAVLIVVVLLILLVILAEHFYSIKNRKNEKSSEQEES